MKAAGTSVLNVGKGVGAAVKDPGATAKGVGAGVKRFGTNLGRKAKRQRTRPSTTWRATTRRRRARTVHDRQGGRGRHRHGVLHARSEQGGAQVGAEGGSRSLHHQPDPEEGAHRHRQDRRGRGHRGEGRGADSDGRERHRERRQPGVGQGPRGAAQDQRAEVQGHRRRRRRDQAALPEQGLLAVPAHAIRHEPARGRVPGCGDYVATAAESDTEREELFFVESAEMLARFHKTAPVVDGAAPIRGRWSRRPGRAEPW